MRRSQFIIGVTAGALVVLPGAVAFTGTVGANAEETTATELTDWISDDGTGAGRELSAMSADGRYVVMVGRSSASGGVWIKDRGRASTPSWQLAGGFLVNPDISGNGKVVSWTQLGSGSKGGQQVYTLDWQNPNAVPRLASVGDEGQSAGNVTDYSALSNDGRYVAFQSMDESLDSDYPAGSTGAKNKVYVHDMVTGDTQMVSVVGGEQVNGNAIKPAITPDGRYVAYASDASALQAISGETETTTYQQVYRYDRQTGTTTPVSVATDGTFGDAISSPIYGPSISDDGTKVAFESDATDLVAGDTNADTDAFVRDLTSGTTTRVSVDEAGAQVDMTNPETTTEPTPTAEPTEGGGGGGGGGGGQGGGGDSTADATPNVGSGPVISGDGNFVAFESVAALTADDLNGEGTYNCDADTASTEDVAYTNATVDVSDVYRYDLVDNTIDRQSKANAGGTEASGFRIDGNTGECVPASNGADPAISADGARVSFTSAGNLTGKTVEEESSDGTSVVEGTAIEPNVYLHRPNPEDTYAPVSSAKSRADTNRRPIKVTYKVADSVFPGSGVDQVQLWVKRPGDSSFSKRQVDSGAEIDNVFFVKTGRGNGRYRFYTVAIDKLGNTEVAPVAADSISRLDTVTPKIGKARVFPRPFDISSDGKAVLKMRISERSKVTFLIKHDGVVVKHYPTTLTRRGPVTRTWKGYTDAGRMVHDGTYVVVMKAKDLAGNGRIARAVLPVTR